MCDYIVLELVQANYQTYLVFTDREDGTFRGAYHYQREIKSGFISLCAEGPEEVELDEDLGLKKIDLATSNGVNSHAQQPKTGDESMIIDQENQHNHFYPRKKINKIVFYIFRKLTRYCIVIPF